MLNFIIIDFYRLKCYTCVVKKEMYTMENKALKILILLLVIPILISIIIALTTDNKVKYGPSHSDNEANNHYTYNEQIKSSNTFIYISVFTLVVVGVGIWAFVKKKGNV